jgi:hypothetical protein
MVESPDREAGDCSNVVDRIVSTNHESQSSFLEIITDFSIDHDV